MTDPLDYIHISGNANWLYYKMQFSINGFEQYIGHDVKTNNNYRMEKFELLDTAATPLYNGQLQDDTSIYKVTSSSDPSNYFYVETHWKDTIVALGDYKTVYNPNPKETQLELFGEKIIIKHAIRKFSASVPRRVLNSISLDKLVTILTFYRPTDASFDRVQSVENALTMRVFPQPLNNLFC